MQEEYYAFFQNRKCEFFPCHEGVQADDFNCLFCYCPLYTLGEHCGGSFIYTESGLKSCVGCAFPHIRGNYAVVIKRFPDLARLAAKSGKSIVADDLTAEIGTVIQPEAAMGETFSVVKAPARKEEQNGV